MDILAKILRRLVLLLAGIAGAGLLTMYDLLHPGKALLEP
jgi:hypothetical protein